MGHWSAQHLQLSKYKSVLYYSLYTTIFWDLKGRRVKEQEERSSQVSKSPYFIELLFYLSLSLRSDRHTCDRLSPSNRFIGSREFLFNLPLGGLDVLSLRWRLWFLKVSQNNEERHKQQSIFGFTMYSVIKYFTLFSARLFALHIAFECTLLVFQDTFKVVNENQHFHFN